MTACKILQAGRIGWSYLRSAIFYGLVGILFAGFGLIQLKWPGLQAVLFFMIGLFLLYEATMNFAESKMFK